MNAPHLVLFLKVCGEKEIQVHRYILASRSPVFKANFDHAETEEGKSGEIFIQDIDYETMLALVRYVNLLKDRTSKFRFGERDGFRLVQCWKSENQSNSTV